MTALHPLATEDTHLIQDYLVTKLTFLLASGAHDDEWQHELDGQQTISGVQWERQNAFLFDYTVARFLATSSRPDPDDALLSPGRRFVQDFVHAVDIQDHVTAEALWHELNEPVTTTAGPRVPSTIQLILELRARARRLDLSRTVTQLPPEFERPQYVS
jgi:hypothetical protein